MFMGTTCLHIFLSYFLMMSDDNFFNPSKLAILSIKFFREKLIPNKNKGALAGPDLLFLGLLVCSVTLAFLGLI